jgi:hypothetical protein
MRMYPFDFSPWLLRYQGPKVKTLGSHASVKRCANRGENAYAVLRVCVQSGPPV